MKNGEWRVENGEWQMKNEKRKILKKWTLARLFQNARHVNSL